MAVFTAMTPGAEVNGQTVLAVVAGMGVFKTQAATILKDNGIADPQPDRWYSQQAWLNAFKVISDKLGPNTLFQIGKKIPENAAFPPEINTIEAALASIDVAYHMNNRGGKIGNYAYKSTGPRGGKMVCDNPFPCDFDRGIVTAMATRFAPAGSVPKVLHDDACPCRRTGGNSCTYLISW
jgi:hypothetical protein